MPSPTPDFSTPGFDLPAVAPRVGPFPGRDFLQTWWEHRRAENEELHFVGDGRALLALWRRSGAVLLAGEEDLTDYHAPRGPRAAEALARYMASLPPRTRFRFDSLPIEAAAVVAEGLAGAGLAADPVEHAACRFVELGGDFEAYLSSLPRKERHEVRRKLRRYEGACGVPRIERDPPGALARFIDLHRRSPGRKGRFMTPEMARFFEALVDLPGARFDLLVGAGGAANAAAFGFCEGDTYYLYNSAYDPDMADLSPGMVLLSLLLASAIGEGLSVFDFLKGDEPYKERLGAVRRPLYVLEGST